MNENKKRRKEKEGILGLPSVKKLTVRHKYLALKMPPP